MQEMTTAIHGENDSLRLRARIEGKCKSGMPNVVIDIGHVRGIPLRDLHKIEEFLTQTYDWRRQVFAKEIRK